MASITFNPPSGGGSYSISYYDVNSSSNNVNVSDMVYFGEGSPSSFQNISLSDLNEETEFTLAATIDASFNFTSWGVTYNSEPLTIYNNKVFFNKLPDRATVDTIVVTPVFSPVIENGSMLTSATNTTLQGTMFTLDPNDVTLDGTKYYTLPTALGSTWTVALNYTPGPAPGEGNNTQQIITQQLTFLEESSTYTDCQCTIGYFGNGNGEGFPFGYYAGVRITSAQGFFLFPLSLTESTSYSIALSLDASKTLRCYVNGTQISTLSGSVPVNEIILDYVPSSSNPLLIGTSWGPGTPTQFITGTLNALHIFPRAVSSTTIQDASDNGLLFELDASKNLVDLIDISSSTLGYNPLLGNALVLDGSSFYTTKNLDTTDLSGPWTVAMRYMELSPPQTGSYSQIISQKYTDGSSRSLSIGYFPAGAQNLPASGPGYYAAVLSSGTWYYSPKLTLNTSGWTDIVASRDVSDNMSLYVNGNLVGAPVYMPTITSTESVYIGKAGGTDDLINGAIAQLLIYDRPMSASEAYFLNTGVHLPLIELTGDTALDFPRRIANEMMKNPDSAIATAMEVAIAFAAANNENINYGAVMTGFLLATTTLDSASAKVIAAELMSNITFNGRQDVIFAGYRDMFYEAIGITGTQPLVAVAPTSTGILNIANISTGSALAFLIKAEGTYTLDTGDTITIDASDNQFFNDPGASGNPLTQGDNITLQNGNIYKILLVDPIWGQVGFHVNSPSFGRLDVSFNDISSQVHDISGYTSDLSGTYVITASDISAGTILSSWLVNDNGNSTTVNNTNNTYSHEYTNTSSYVEVTAQYLSSKLTVVKPDPDYGSVTVNTSPLTEDTDYYVVGPYTLVATPAQGQVFSAWDFNGKLSTTYTSATLSSYDFTITGSNVTITPVFVPASTLTILYPSPAFGRVSVNYDGNTTVLTQDISFNTSGVYTVRALAEPGYTFTNWIKVVNGDTNNNASSSTPYEVSFSNTDTVVVSANFVSNDPGAICFLKDAPVLTPTGYKRISSLKVGDLVKTAEGKAVPIQSVKVQHTRPSQAVNPYVIPKGRFGATKELFISPEHKVQVNGAMVEARSLGLKQNKMTEPFDYYNLELPNYEKMIVAGVTVESMFPITRVKISMEQFKQILVTKYGNATPEVLARILRNTRILPDGCVEVPADRRAVQRASM